MEIDEDRFHRLVADALDTLPGPLAAAIDNVVVVVRDGTPGGSLFGRYRGVPLTERGDYGAGGGMPDEITLYRRTIAAECSTEAEVVRQVGVTVVHEIAHHFGIDDERLHELGWA